MTHVNTNGALAYGFPRTRQDARVPIPRAHTAADAEKASPDVTARCSGEPVEPAAVAANLNGLASASNLPS